MFCCQGFQNLIGEAGQRGLAALVHSTPDGFRFYLESRAVSKLEEIRLSQDPEPWPQPRTVDEHVTLSCAIQLIYCPLCGSKLQSLIKRSTRRAFEELAKSHMTIFPPL